MRTKKLSRFALGLLFATMITACSAKQETSQPEQTPQGLSLQERFTQKLEQVATLENVKYKKRELLIGGAQVILTQDSANPYEHDLSAIVNDYFEETGTASWQLEKNAFPRENISGVRIDDEDTAIYHLGFLSKDGYDYLAVVDGDVTGYSGFGKDVYTVYDRYLCHDVLGNGSCIDVFKIKQCENLIDKDYKEYYLIKNTWADSRDKAEEYEKAGYEVIKNDFEKSERISITKTIKLPVEDFGKIAYGIRFLNNDLGFVCAGGEWTDYPVVKVTMDGGDTWQEISFEDIVAPQYFTKYKPCCIEIYGEMIQIRCQCYWREDIDRTAEDIPMNGIEPFYIISDDCGKTWSGYVKMRDDDKTSLYRNRYLIVTEPLPTKFITED